MCFEDYSTNDCDFCKRRWKCPNNDVEVWYCPYFELEDDVNMLLY